MSFCRSRTNRQINAYWSDTNIFLLNPCSWKHTIKTSMSLSICCIQRTYRYDRRNTRYTICSMCLIATTIVTTYHRQTMNSRGIYLLKIYASLSIWTSIYWNKNNISIVATKILKTLTNSRSYFLTRTTPCTKKVDNNVFTLT